MKLALVALLPLAASCIPDARAQDLGDQTVIRHALSVEAIGDGMLSPQGGGVLPIFDLNPGAGSGYANLPDALGTTGATLALACDGHDAVPSTSWACRSAAGAVNLVNAENGSSPQLVRVPMTNAAERAVDFNASSDFFAGPSSSSLDIGTTEDFAVEVVYLGGGPGDGYFGKKADATAAGVGWATYCNASNCNNFRMAVSDGTNQVVTASSTVGSNAWTHGICFFKRSDASGARCCADGLCGTALSTAAIDANSLSNALTFAVGSWHSTHTTEEYGQPVAAVRFWSCTGCLTTADYQTIATERHQRLTGFWPTAVGSKVATTLTRASNATLDIDHDEDGTRRMFTVSYSWPRTIKRKENTGGQYITGVLVEPSTTNLLLQSQTLADASWTEANINAVSEGSDVAVDDSATADTLESVDGAGSVEHYHREPVTITAVTHTFSAFVKAGGDSATHAWLRDATVANAIGWINLSTCAAGTAGAGLLDLHAASWGSGWCRIGITFTGTAASHNFDIGYSNADNVTAYDDGTDSTADLIAWGGEVEAFPWMTSYQATTTATVTRAGDDYQFNAADGNAQPQGTMAVTALCPDYDVASTTSLMAVGSAASNRYLLHVSSTNDRLTFVGDVTTSQWDLSASAGDGADGEVHEVRGTYATNDIELFRDGVTDGTDASANLLGSMSGTSIYIGGAPSATASGNCVVSRARIWDREVKP